MTPLLTHDEARRFYDRLGSKQDFHLYENRAFEELVRYGGFDRAGSVFEFGHGTGRLAERLLKEHLPERCRYTGVDISPTMAGLAKRRLEPFRLRVSLVLTDGSPKLNLPDSAFDRFVSTYVIDLLSEEDIDVVLEEAYRVLTAGGLLCLAGLTYGKGPLGRIVTRLWERVHSVRPALVGGCRPVKLLEYLPGERWRITHHTVITSFGISSEVVVAEKTVVPTTP